VFVLAGEVLGGAERNALLLAAHLAHERGAVVEVCALDDRPGRARAVAETQGLRWTSVPVPWSGSRRAKASSLLRAARSIRRLRPDALLPSTNLPNVVCGLTWRLTGAQVSIWNQCDVLPTSRFSAAMFRRALHSSPLAVTTAFQVRDWLAREWDADPGKVHVIRSEVRLPPAERDRVSWRDALGLEDGELAASMLGHLHSGKDHDTLLRAWRLVVEEMVTAGERAPVLLLAGREAGTHHAVKALAYDLGLRDRVRFLGEVTDISGLLEASDLGVFSSRSEALGRGATEPMYAALAVAATDVPGIREAVGAPGLPFLSAPGDIESLAATILRLARDADLRVRVGRENAKLIRERQSAKETTAVYAELVARALSGRGRGQALEGALVATQAAS
jgi:glycosyltransferase involved in cell wall biosynthesis